MIFDLQDSKGVLTDLSNSILSLITGDSWAGGGAQWECQAQAGPASMLCNVLNTVLAPHTGTTQAALTCIKPGEASSV